ncbi:MAG: Dak phosphatase, partial [bacterium]
MYLLRADDSAVPALRAALDALGDSLVVVGGDGLWNVHVHVDDAGAAVEAGMAAGVPHRIRISPLGRSQSHAGATAMAVVSGRLVAVARGPGTRGVREAAGVVG